jgi:hypothetical protein
MHERKELEIKFFRDALSGENEEVTEYCHRILARNSDEMWANSKIMGGNRAAQDESGRC